jgi:hypothetical protein
MSASLSLRRCSTLAPKLTRRFAGASASDTFDVLERNIEEAYFNKLDATQRAGIDEKRHANEFKSLLKVLPKSSNLSHTDLYKIIMWKVQD